MIALKRILVATDFGEAAEVALNYGREFARLFGANIDVLHVAENVTPRAFGTDAIVPNFAELQREVDEAARRHLDALLTDEDRRELNATPVLLTSPATARTIVQYAKESGADLILIGTHGRSTMEQLLMGTVAERVVRFAPCPVLTVRHPEREFVLPDALIAVAKA